MNFTTRARLGKVRGLISLDQDRATLGGSDVGVYLPFNALEPNRPANETTMVQLVSELDRDAALLACGVLNCIVSGSGIRPVLERQRAAFDGLRTPGDAAMIDRWIRSRTIKSEVVIFFRGQLLELMRWIARYAPVGATDLATLDDPKLRRTFLRAALLASELWSARTVSDRLTGGTTPASAIERALSPFRKGIEEGGSAPHIGVALGRGALLFRQYLPARLPTFPRDFEAAVGLSIDDYLSCAAALMMKALDQPTDGYLFRATYGNATQAREKFATFLRLEAQTPENLAHGLWDEFDVNGYKRLRERPVLETVSGDYVVADPTFFIDHMMISPLFKVLGGSISTNAVFSGFGDAFEDYCIDILKRLYPAPAGLVQRLFTNVPSHEHNPQFKIDALINEGKDVIVAEIKAVFLQEKATLSEEPEDFLAELKRKYAVAPGKQSREVGVAQLAKAVRAIVVDCWNGGEIEHDALQRLYPLLIVHDTRLSFPGLGAILNEWFLECLGSVPAGRVRIAPLTLITIDDLENQESSQEFTLLDALRAYAIEGRAGMVTFHNFLARSPTFQPKIRPSETLVEASMAEAERLRVFFFGDSEVADA